MVHTFSKLRHIERRRDGVITPKPKGMEMKQLPTALPFECVCGTQMSIQKYCISGTALLRGYVGIMRKDRWWLGQQEY
jgi:hypothetical protein